jgi:RND family efflux transporter MFP subunit
VETQAAAAVKAAEAQLSQFNASRNANAGGAGMFVIRAPIAGVIVARQAAPGMNVAAGTPLFQLVNPARVHVVGRIPEGRLTRARAATAALIEFAPHDTVRAGRLVSVGRVIDPQSRTLPITFAVDAAATRTLVGQSVFLQLLLDAAPAAPVAPAPAIVDEAGRPVVFVQTAGESFERRPVTIGAREGDWVQLTSGVAAGERIVTRGAYLVRLASLSTAVPAHGHVH